MANEKRLIDANALKKAIWNADCNVYEFCEGCVTEMGLSRLLLDDVIDEVPTVDAVEVVHGYWIDSYSTDHMGRIIEHSIDCSVCDSVFKDDSREVVQRWKERFKACPFCGAIMDGDGNADV